MQFSYWGISSCFLDASFAQLCCNISEVKGELLLLLELPSPPRSLYLQILVPPSAWHTLPHFGQAHPLFLLGELIYALELGRVPDCILLRMTILVNMQRTTSESVLHPM